MLVTVVSPPEPVVTLEEAKRHLRVEHGDDDAYIPNLVEVATSWLDGPDGCLGRSLGEQILEATFPVELPLDRRCYPLPPFRGIDGEVLAPDGKSSVVRWRAGYPLVNDRSSMPAPIRHAILLMVGHLYANREAVTSTAAKPETLPLGVDALLSPYRTWLV